MLKLTSTKAVKGVKVYTASRSEDNDRYQMYICLVFKYNEGKISKATFRTTYMRLLIEPKTNEFLVLDKKGKKPMNISSDGR